MRAERTAPHPTRPLTAGQLAEREGISRATVVRTIEAGWLPAWRTSPNGHWRIDPDEADRYFAGLTSPGRDTPTAA